MFKIITSKPLWVNILAAIGIVVVLVLLFFGMLSWITRHNETEKVPLVVGQNVAAATQTLEAKGFRIIVSDSVYDGTVSPLNVTRQSPEADAVVKAGRTIFLSVNRSVAPTVDMPNLIGYSFRSANLYLQSLQLKLGDTSYRPDIARNAVLQQMWNKQDIKPGTPIPLGSTISLILGSGMGNDNITVPDLIGLTVANAKAKLIASNLGVGAIVALENVKDTANAFVVRQTPNSFVVNDAIKDSTGNSVVEYNKVHPGQLIDIYIGNTAPAKDTLSIKK